MTTRTLLVSDWLRIDATLDNTGAVERVGGDPELAEAVGRIREEGWRASRAHRQSGEGFGGWPPADAALPIRLGPAEWGIVRQELDRWRAVTSQRLARARTDQEAADLRDSIRWSDAMRLALDAGTAAPRTGL